MTTDHGRWCSPPPTSWADATSGVPGAAQAIDRFLTAATEDSRALVIDGEAGVGKTTLWWQVITEARTRGIRVLTARADATAPIPYAAIAELLGGLDGGRPNVAQSPFEALGDAADNDTVVGPESLAATLTAALVRLVEQSPLLIAIDDLHVLDPMSVRLLTAVARRLPARVSIVATARTQPSSPSTGWLELPRPDALDRFEIQPLSMSGVHQLVSQRLRRSLSRPQIRRIHQVSRGNPSFALELARACASGRMLDGGPLPHCAIEPVTRRFDGLPSRVREMLLVASCDRDLTVDMIVTAVGGDVDEVIGSIEEAESRGILLVDGCRVHFTHPVLANQVYVDATPGQRRAAHRTLAALVDHPDQRARHVALGAMRADQRVLESLDAAADGAHSAGSPGDAAELLDLAIRLGGDTPTRRIRSAQLHVDAGDPATAACRLDEALTTAAPGTPRGEVLHERALAALCDGGPFEAVELLERALIDADDSLQLRVNVMIALSHASAHCGDTERAQRVADDAIAEATRWQRPALLSGAIAMKATLQFLRGEGVDEAGMRQAVELHDDSLTGPLPFRPDVQRTLVSAWTGALGDARHRMHAIRRECIDGGREGDMVFVNFHIASIEVWRANLNEAAVLVDDSVERAAQMGGDLSLSMALTASAMVRAHQGREDQARNDIARALVGSRRCGARWLEARALSTLGFLEVSLGNHDAALDALQPLLARLADLPAETEMITAAFIPDAVESMSALALLDEAEELASALESNGRRLNRPWALAVGARCRALVCASRGDIDEAVVGVQAAMTHHEHLEMPFESARTRLLLGEIQRRHRLKAASEMNVMAAMRAFEELGTTLWAARASTTLARTHAAVPKAADGLSSSEWRVAELVAMGMTNRAIASALFISPKTVEATLARIYRKLDIPSRAALASYVGETSARETSA